MKVKELIKDLERLDPEDHIAGSFWSIEDLDDISEDVLPKISLTDKNIIIDRFHAHDAEIGYSWEGLSNEFYDYLDRRLEETT